ncbi:MAG: aminotransferase class III-fold pyridoxal phosphate-dependent enzyme, partial [Gammaproteobacteria bacterium]|nr:aminotransferase class III-fold pyridoxal phosphate-dependent enzyme [Gammaproteobacteria bacterium]
YQAGTLSGNPVAMAAGLKNLELISKPGFFAALTEKTRQLSDGLRERAQSCGIPLSTNQVGAMFGFFFTEEASVNLFEQVCACDAERFKRFYHGMLEQGIYMAPSSYETGFVSSAHSDEDLARTLQAAEAVFKTL